MSAPPHRFVASNFSYVADIILVENQLVATPLLYRWNGSIWEPAENWLANRVEQLYITNGAHFKHQYLKEVRDIIVARQLIQGEQMNFSSRYIPFSNGYYDTLAQQVVSPQIGQFLTYRFDWDYDPQAQCPQFNAFLERALGAESRTQLLSYLAYCFTNSNLLKKAMALVGPTDTGKTVLMELLKQIYGQLYTEAPLSTIGSGFEAYSLEGKLINIYDELNDVKMPDDAAFKRLTSTSSIDVNAKYIAKKVRIRMMCRFLFATNKLPVPGFRVDDSFWNRWIIIPFENVIPKEEQDIHLRERLVDEIPGIINLILRYLSGAEQVLQGIDRNQMKELWMRYSDGINEFISTMCVEEPEGEVVQKVLYDHYVEWAKQMNYTVARSEYFNGRMRSRGFHEHHVNVANAWMWRGIKLKESE